MAGLAYANVIAEIQKTPKTLTLQVVPKAFDILQTVFNDTCGKSLVEKQETIYSTLQELATAKSIQKNTSQTQSLPMYKQKENIPQIKFHGVEQTSAVVGSNNNNYSDSNESALMNRMRKSLEQKEEFLRRPSQPYVFNKNFPMPVIQNKQSQQENVQREYYARPSRLVDYDFLGANLGQSKQAITSTSSQDLTSMGVSSFTNSRLSNQSALREQFFSSTYSPPPSTYSFTKLASPTPLFSSTPTSPHLPEPMNQIHSLGGSASNIMCTKKSLNSTTVEAGEKHLVSSASNSSFPVLRIVDNLTKQFETGRPLSPDGIIDRTAFHKSELSRLNTKQAEPNVALRRQVFEMKAESANWRRSTGELYFFFLLILSAYNMTGLPRKSNREYLSGTVNR